MPATKSGQVAKLSVFCGRHLFPRYSRLRVRLVGARLAAPVQLYGAARIGGLVYGERLDPPAVLGMSLIVAGLVVLNLFSKTASH